MQYRDATVHPLLGGIIAQESRTKDPSHTLSTTRL